MPALRDRALLLLALLCALSPQGGASLAQTGDILVITHRDVNARHLTRSDLSAIYRSIRRDWADGGRVVAFNLAPRSAHRVVFDRAVLRMGPEAVTRFWIDERIRGGGRPPRAVPSAELMSRVVAQVPGAIGYVRANQSVGNVHVVARIVNNQILEP